MEKPKVLLFGVAQSPMGVYPKIYLEDIEPISDRVVLDTDEFLPRTIPPDVYDRFAQPDSPPAYFGCAPQKLRDLLGAYGFTPNQDIAVCPLYSGDGKRIPGQMRVIEYKRKMPVQS